MGKPLKTKEQFVKDAVGIHGPIYNYKNVIYINTKTKVEIFCQKHQKFFWQQPQDHLQGHGCPDCGNENISKKKLRGTDYFIKKSKIKHGLTYDYSLSLYVGANEKIEIICTKCGNSFWQNASDHWNGCGCKTCSKSGFKDKLPSILYYLQDIKTGLYKIGISNRSVNERFKRYKKRIKIISIRYFLNGVDARKKEVELQKQFQEYQTDNREWMLKKESNGFTEFYTKDVLEEDKILIPYLK